MIQESKLKSENVVNEKTRLSSETATFLFSMASVVTTHADTIAASVKRDQTHARVKTEGARITWFRCTVETEGIRKKFSPKYRMQKRKAKEDLHENTEQFSLFA